jgi:hypothetical protein
MCAANPRRSLILALLLLATACAPSEDPARGGDGAEDPAGDRSAPPSPLDPDVVLLVDEVEIRASEVESFAEGIARIWPEYSATHCRRLALEARFLPHAALRAQFPQEHERAVRRALETLELSPPLSAFPPTQLEGDFRHLGLDLWLYARDLTPGVWNGPLERVGCVVLVKLIRIEAGEERAQDRLTLSLVNFPLGPPIDAPLEAPLDAQAAIDRSRLTIVDPAWEKAIPQAIRYRMAGDSR